MIEELFDELYIIKHQNKQILSALNTDRRMSFIMARTLDEVLAEAERNTTLDASLLAMMDGVREQLKASGMNSMDQARVDKIFDELKANNDRAAAALAAGTTPPTPAEPTPAEPTPAEGTATGGSESSDVGSIGGADPNE
jgi:hypothetical protein